MKRYLKLYGAILVLGISLFTSCAKEADQFTNDGNGGANGIVELADLVPRASSTAFASVTKSFLSQPEVDCPIVVNYTGVNGAPEDVTITLGLDNSIVATNTALTVLPESLYTPSSFTLTIPKGQKSATLNLKLKTSQFNFALTYALGIKILSTSSGILSRNYGSGIFIIGAKNAYDGVYTVEAGSSVLRFSNPTTPAVNDVLNGSLAGNPNMTLTTATANSVVITNLRWAGGTSSVSGIESLTATVDPVTNLVTMSSGVNATLVNRTGLDNKYDPATKTFRLNFHWNLTSTKREVALVLKYSGARP
ncbi:MAG: DUF1735 domain-containing protein [Pedobacter sp.]|nr:MAG: DUF1735 domain-containing protein [Pedobacter sp.]